MKEGKKMQKKTKKNMLKRAMALSCAFALSLAPAVENVTVNAQTNADENTVSEQETQETDEEKSVVSTQGLVQTMAAKETKVVNNPTDFVKAINNQNVDKIILSDHVRLTDPVEIKHEVTIASKGTAQYQIGIEKNKAVRLFSVTNNAKVTFKNVDLKGGYRSNGANHAQTTNTVLAVVNGSVSLESCKVFLSKGILLRIDGGSTVTANNTEFSESSGKYNTVDAAIYIENGKFIMNGNASKIKDNKYGGVRVSKNGTFTMNEGTISGNSSKSGATKGGGVFNNGTFTFKAGTIKGNIASECGNNVYNAGTMKVTGPVTMDSIYLANSDITFNSALKSPATAKLGFSDTVGTKVASCGSGINAGACLAITGKEITNSPEDSSSIIITENYDITIDQGNEQGSTTETKAYLDKITLPSSATRIGYDLSGWASDQGEVGLGEQVTVKGNATYTAQWTPKTIKVKYFIAGEPNPIHEDSYVFDNQASYVIHEEVKKTGYTFKGWEDVTNGSVKKIYDAKATGDKGLNRTTTDSDLELQAVYEEKEVPVKFVLNMDGATMTTTEAKVKYESKLNLKDYNPEVTGYLFDGWYTTADYKGEQITILSPAELKMEDEIQLYAKWKAKDIPVSYDVTISGAQNKVKYDEKLVLPSAPVQSGKIFKGWHLNGNTSKVYKEGETICPKDLKTEGISLKAVYELAATPKPSSSTSDKKGSSSSTSSSSKVSETKLEEKLPGDAPETASGSAASLKLSVSNKTLGVGDRYHLIIDTNDAYTVSSNTNIIDVNNLGDIKARSVGTAVITVKTASTSKICKITVKKAPTASTMKVLTKKVKRGKTVSVKPFLTKNTYCKALKYSSSNKKIAKVTSKGKLKGLKKGTVKITIKCSTGAKKVVKIKVV